MDDIGTMFEPLTDAERATTTAAAIPGEKIPIVPVPPDALPMRFQHPAYGAPTAQYPYHLGTGELAGYACRFDFSDANGEPSKIVLPVTYCDLGNGRYSWRGKGIPAPRPLYRSPDILARPDAPLLVCEGEKAADAAAQIFVDYVATTPMHGAKSPHLADW